jgi:hypothetical protein
LLEQVLLAGSQEAAEEPVGTGTTLDAEADERLETPDDKAGKGPEQGMSQGKAFWALFEIGLQLPLSRTFAVGVNYTGEPI